MNLYHLFISHNEDYDGDATWLVWAESEEQAIAVCRDTQLGVDVDDPHEVAWYHNTYDVLYITQVDTTPPTEPKVAT